MARNNGADYDYHIDEVADIIHASGGVKTIRQALLEWLATSPKLPVTDETAAKRFRGRWKRESPSLLAGAAERAEKRKAAETMAKLNAALFSDAMELRELAEGPAPYSDMVAMPIRLFLKRATPVDYQRNPMVPRVMSFGTFQIAHERQAVLAKLKVAKST